MNLNEMKKIADARTKGKWGFTNYKDFDNRDRNIGIIKDGYFGDDIIKRDSGVYPPDNCDADFIIMAANNFDKLLAVVEAASASPIVDHWSEEYCNGREADELSEAVEKLKAALKELEKD